MKKALRILWLVFASIAFFPILLLVEVYCLYRCIRAAKYLDNTVKDGVKSFVEWMKAGIQMNIDFVNNGL